MNFWDDLATRIRIKNLIDERKKSTDAIVYNCKSTGYHNVFFQLPKNWIPGDNIETCIILDSSSLERPLIIPLISIEYLKLALYGSIEENDDVEFVVNGCGDGFVKSSDTPSVLYSSVSDNTPFTLNRYAQALDQNLLTTTVNSSFKTSFDFSGLIYMEINDTLYLPDPGDFGVYLYDIVKIDDDFAEKNKHLLKGVI